MNDGETTKKYDTNPLDKRVAERAEAEMGQDDPETEAPTRAMPLMDIPDAGGETRQMPPRDTGPQPATPTGSAQVPSTAPTRGMYTPPGGTPAPFAEPQGYPPPSQVYDYPSQAHPPAVYTPAGPPATNPYAHPPYPQKAGGSEALGLKPNFAAMLGYLPLIGIAAAFLFVILEPARNRFVRFHAKQALLAHLAFWVVLAAFNIARGIAPGFIGFLLILPQMVFFAGSMVGFIMMMVKALAGERAKIPILGDQAE